MARDLIAAPIAECSLQTYAKGKAANALAVPIARGLASSGCMETGFNQPRLVVWVSFVRNWPMLPRRSVAIPNFRNQVCPQSGSRRSFPGSIHASFRRRPIPATRQTPAAARNWSRTSDPVRRRNPGWMRRLQLTQLRAPPLAPRQVSQAPPITPIKGSPTAAHSCSPLSWFRRS
jgi:hypothetical protein